MARLSRCDWRHQQNLNADRLADENFFSFLNKKQKLNLFKNFTFASCPLWTRHERNTIFENISQKLLLEDFECQE